MNWIYIDPKKPIPKPNELSEEEDYLVCCLNSDTVFSAYYVSWINMFFCQNDMALYNVYAYTTDKIPAAPIPENFPPS